MKYKHFKALLIGVAVFLIGLFINIVCTYLLASNNYAVYEAIVFAVLYATSIISIFAYLILYELKKKNPASNSQDDEDTFFPKE